MTMLAEPNGGPVKPFLDHLEDLRGVLLKCLAVLAAGMAFAGALAPRLLNVLKHPLRSVVADPDRFLRTLEVTGGVALAMQTALWGGLFLSTPLMLAILAGYLGPALKPAERRALGSGLVFASLLFVGGILLGYFYALPAALRIMLWFNEWMGIPVEFWRVTDYIAFVLRLLLAFGLTFELPAVLMALGRLGLVRSDQLRGKRRHAVVLALALAMIITPTTDPATQVMLATPLIVLYEISIWTTRLWERRRRQQPHETAPPAAR